MTIEELIGERDEIKRRASELEQARQDVADKEAATTRAVRARDAAQASHNAAQVRLFEFTNGIWMTQAELQAAQDEQAGLTAQLAMISENTIVELRDAIALIRPQLWPLGRPDLETELDALDARLVALLAADLETRLVELSGVFDQARSILGQLPFLAEAQVTLDAINARETETEALQQQRAAAVERVAAATALLTSLQVQLPAAEDEAARASAQLDAAQQAFGAAASALQVATTHRDRLQREFDQLSQQYQQHLDGLIPSLDQTVPLALLPIRLETRYRGNDLWVRVYPDDLHQDNGHDPRLTEEEVTRGQWFWQQWDAAEPQASTRRAQRLRAWEQVCARFGPGRAAWIARVMQPTNGVFPTPAVRAAAQPPPAQVRVLPDRWLALGYVKDDPAPVFAQWGDLIPDPLPTGPSPDGDADTELAWLMDFEQALAKGMALKIALVDPRISNRQIARLIVLGVKATLDSRVTIDRLEQWLDAHHYTWGLGLIPQGTPTNNAPEARSGYTGRDAGFEASFDREHEQEQRIVEIRDVLQHLRAEAQLDIDLAAKALGVTGDLFTGVQHADAHAQEDARHMNAVLWPATWGYFLSVMMTNTEGRAEPWTPYLEEWADYFADYVRACGPLPALRIGNQPYGLLPVTALDRWQPRDRHPGLPQQPIPGLPMARPGSPINLLIQLRERWQKAVVAAPHFGRRSTAGNFDPGQNLLEILSMSATSHAASARALVGQAYAANLWWLQRNPLDQAWWDALRRETNKTQPVYSPERLLASAAFAADTATIEWPLVREDLGSSSLSWKTEDNYIAWLAKATPQEIHAHSYRGGPVLALLYHLLRHATLQAYSAAALRLVPQDPAIGEPELIDLTNMVAPDFVTPAPTKTYWRHLAGIAPYRENLGDWLHRHPDLKLAGFRASLKALSQLPVERLEWLTGEVLDLASHRLDAWVTSCATYRLHQMRQSRGAGIHLGGYGWVENLRPRETQPASTGYIHAPSVAQAATAAILRSGFMAYGEEGLGKALAIDLSSRRVRSAQWLLGGVRSGQSLGALLGYRFERGLQTRGLSRYIDEFRAMHPLAADKLIKKASGQKLEEIAADNVVDGLTLLSSWREKTFQAPASATSDEQKAIEAELQALQDAVDAISDLAVAESMYHLVQGNPARAGASLDAISRFEAIPAEFDVTRTPRTGIALNHRLLALFPGELAPNDGYAAKWSGQNNPRAQTEPYLNAWAARLLGNPEDILFFVEYAYPDSARPGWAKSPRRKMSFQDLALCPLDVVYWPISGDQPQLSDVEQWIAYEAMRTRNSYAGSPGDIPLQATLRLFFARDDAAWDAHGVTIPEILEIARAIRDLISGASLLDRRSLAQPGNASDPAIDRQDLQQRADGAIASLKTAHQRLKQLLTASFPANVNDLRAALVALVRFGVPGAVPQSPAGSTDEARASLQDQASRVSAQVAAQLQRIELRKANYDLQMNLTGDGALVDLDELRQQMTRLAVLGVQAATPIAQGGMTTAEHRTRLLAQARQALIIVGVRLDRVSNGLDATTELYLGYLGEVFGRDFRALPRFTADGASLKHAFDLRQTIKDAGPEATIPWFQRIARVRDGAARLNEVLLYAETIGAADTLGFQVAQLPLPESSMAPDRWVGLATDVLKGGKMSLVAHAPLEFDPEKSLAGLLIDAWDEVVPNRAETTAVAFHYDAPGAQAPQAILLAVSPDLNRQWDEETLAAVINETLDLTKLRAVDPDVLADHTDLGHYLPATYLARNKGGEPNGETIATDFAL
jgi:hypothetical protein